jgi:hypothetical protein
MEKFVKGAVLVFAIVTLVGCITIPEPSPLRIVTYRLDKDKQQWTQSVCVTTHTLQAHRVESVCREQMITAPPPGIEKRLDE